MGAGRGRSLTPGANLFTLAPPVTSSGGGGGGLLHHRCISGLVRPLAATLPNNGNMKQTVGVWRWHNLSYLNSDVC